MSNPVPQDDQPANAMTPRLTHTTCMRSSRLRVNAIERVGSVALLIGSRRSSGIQIEHLSQDVLGQCARRPIEHHSAPGEAYDPCPVALRRFHVMKAHDDGA